ncbi:MAG: methyltransferase domain-containing protein [Parcubacteria group bacterium]|nr:methyltransferase domain-containing protein [Parcubacteria group bacterium]
MPKKYFFILGNTPLLSVAEIVSVLRRENRAFRITAFHEPFCIIELFSYLEDSFITQLGGTIKFGEIVSSSATITADVLRSFLPLPPRGGKIVFGISLYGKNDKRLIKGLALDFKKLLKLERISSRWVAAKRSAFPTATLSAVKESTLSSAEVFHNHLIKKGAEFVIFDINRAPSDTPFFLGKTMAVQDFERYSERDWDRPSKSMQSGMLPPKVAQMMINLAMAPRDGIILDPFCGSGTIITEALLMGYKKVVGTDVDTRAIENTKKNVEWTMKKYNIIGASFDTRAIDARSLSKNFPTAHFDAIITEPYLGPTQPINEFHELKYILSELEELYCAAFREFKTIVKPRGRIVIIFPIFLFRNKKHFCDIIGKIERYGFQQYNILKEYPDIGYQPIILEAARNEHTSRGSQSVPSSQRYSLLYARQESKIIREIFVFEKI